MSTEERLEMLERQMSAAKRRNRWMLAGLGLCLGIALVAWALGPTVATAQPAGAAPKVVRANQFILEDERGRIRAMLAVTKDGPVLTLSDEKGKDRAILGVLKTGLRLSLSDEKGQMRAILAVLKHGPMFHLYDEEGKTRAALAMTSDEPSLSLSDEKGKTRAALGVTKSGARLSLSDEKGQMRAWMGMIDVPGIRSPGSSLLLFAPDGKMIWKAP